MIEHDVTLGAALKLNYYVSCTCGFERLFIQTLSEQRKARDKHLSDVEKRKLWYAISPSGEISNPYDTKYSAMLHAGVNSAKRVKPGVYMRRGWTFALEPE